jgi:hypothetical protein
MEALGALGFVLIVVGTAWAILMFCIPFMVFAMSGKLDKLIKLQTESNRINGVISQNVYAHITKGGYE